jgi:hypothetical protein
MYIFKQDVFQIGGNTSEGILMQASSDKKRVEIRQYFERHGFEDVEFSDLAAFCDFLVKKYFKDDRKVFFRAQSNSRNYLAYSTSPYKGHENEVFVIGEFVDDSYL